VCVCDAESSADPGCTVSANEASPQEIKQAFHSSDGVGLWTCQLADTHWRPS